MREFDEESNFLNIDLELLHETILQWIVNILFYLFNEAVTTAERQTNYFDGTPALVCRQNSDGKHHLVYLDESHSKW